MILIHPDLAYVRDCTTWQSFHERNAHNRGTAIITWFNLLVLGLVAAIGALWWNSIRAKELAVSHARRSCEREQLQLLDQTVALTKLRVSRGKSGSACLRRHYGFEFTRQDTSHDLGRDRGFVTMNGHALVQVTLPYTRDEDGNRVFIH